MSYTFIPYSEAWAILMYWRLYEQAKLAEGLQAKTLRDYHASILAFVSWKVTAASGPTTPEQIQSWLATLKCSQFRKRNHWVALRSMYTWLVESGYQEKNLMDGIPAPKVPKTIIEIYRDDEIATVLRYIETERPSKRYAIRDSAMIRLYHRTGARGSELLKVRVDDVDLRKQTLKIHGKGARDRVIPYDETCAVSFHLWLTINDNELCFPITLNRAEQIFKKACGCCNVKHRGLHCLRHTFASNYLKNQGNPLDLMYLLGHSSLAMVNHYSQWLASDRAIENYHRVSKKW